MGEGQRKKEEQEEKEEDEDEEKRDKHVYIIQGVGAFGARSAQCLGWKVQGWGQEFVK